MAIQCKQISAFNRACGSEALPADVATGKTQTTTDVDPDQANATAAGFDQTQKIQKIESEGM